MRQSVCSFIAVSLYRRTAAAGAGNFAGFLGFWRDSRESGRIPVLLAQIPILPAWIPVLPAQIPVLLDWIPDLLARLNGNGGGMNGMAAGFPCFWSGFLCCCADSHASGAEEWEWGREERVATNLRNHAHLRRNRAVLIR